MEDHRRLDGKGNLNTGTAHSDGEQHGTDWSQQTPAHWRERCHKMSPRDQQGAHERWARGMERCHTHLKEQML